MEHETSPTVRILGILSAALISAGLWVLLFTLIYGI